MLGIGQSVYWQARQPDVSGACYISNNCATEAQAKKACEAALLRLGVLEPGEDWVASARRMLNIGWSAHDQEVVAIARALAALEVEAEG